MVAPWLKTGTAEGVEAFSVAFWQRHQGDIVPGRFWADAIEDLRAQLVERLRLALDNLPLPAAFREAAAAMRTLIREERRVGRKYDKDLVCCPADSHAKSLQLGKD